MSDPKKPEPESIQLPAEGIKIKIDANNDRNMPYLKADIFQVSRIGDDFTVVIHQNNYQFIVEELQAGRTEINEKATVTVGKFVMNKEGFMRLKEQIDEIYTKWQTQIAKKQVE